MRALVSNRGSAVARDVDLVVHPEGEPQGVVGVQTRALGTLAPGTSREVVIEFVLGDSLTSQRVCYRFEVHEVSGRVHPATTVEFSTAASALPAIGLSWHLENRALRVLDAPVPGDTLYLAFSLHNAGGTARGVSLHLDRLSGARLLDWDDTLYVVGNLLEGDSVTHRMLAAVDAEEAADSLQAALSVLEERPARTRQWAVSIALAGSAEAILLRGNEAFQRGEVEAALEFYSQAVRRDPGLARAHLLQGLVYEYLGDKQHCLPAIRRAAQLGDATAQAWLNDRNRLRPPSVTYVPLRPNPFEEIAPGAGLAVLPFEQDGGSDVAARVYRVLARSGVIRNRFTLYSPSSLEEQQSALGLSGLDPESDAVREALRAVDIRFVLYGEVAGESPLRLTLRCVRTDDGTKLLEQKLRESETSTALDDAVRLLAEGRRPVYHER